MKMLIGVWLLLLLAFTGLMSAWSVFAVLTGRAEPPLLAILPVFVLSLLLRRSYRRRIVQGAGDRALRKRGRP